MAGRVFFAALAVACSLTPAIASGELATVTAAPKTRHTSLSYHDLAERQPATTYETNSPLPLTQYQYPYSAVPEQVNPFAVGRGPQFGYNRCNSSTEGPTSNCQTLMVNSLDDFCVWGSSTPNGLIGDVEAAVVAYCSKPGHGTRIMPAGTITGAQFMRTKAYVQVTGHFNQSGIGLAQNDTGGELDPHGADNMGNPIGGLVYSNGLPSAKDNTTLLQANNWNNFVGSGVFCIKLCDPTDTTSNFCENRDDLLGCEYNMPASYIDGQFTSCEGELQDVVGIYTANGQTMSWAQPAALPATLPWQPRIPASSNCITYSSEQLYGATTASASVTRTTISAGASTTKTPSSTVTAGSSSVNGAGQLSSPGLLAFFSILVTLI